MTELKITENYLSDTIQQCARQNPTHLTQQTAAQLPALLQDGIKNHIKHINVQQLTPISPQRTSV